MSISGVVAVVRSAVSGYGRHADAQFAAALAYRALFSIVPFVALLASVLDMVLSSSAREQVVDWLLGALPGSSCRPASTASSPARAPSRRSRASSRSAC